MARRRRRVTVRVSIRPSDKRLLDPDDPVIRRNPVARRHQPAQDMPEVIERNPEYIDQGLRLLTTLEQRSLDSSEVEAICSALTHVKTRSRRQKERTASAVGAVFVFVYTEDMYKMMRDTNRQLEDNIGPAVPVCIASGRSPVIQRHPG
ncbi:hypothetical protein ALC57_08500 [Trachymyrmex cornetzi]|uniref:Uncharacterized protein n=1 Tax=Trachymyrmex cornetzi TaxID=471704 RepID=A0A195E2N2_9HYME|nr:hypothetical protein ALC57_08500 [Trachymyrmex cornetzi]